MRHYFAPLFEPAAVAIVGASERKGSIGSVLIENMLAAGYRGQLCAVNPKHRAVRGVPCFPTIGEVPRRVDLAVIATPAPTVPGIIEQCGAAGVRAAVVISAGFSESGPAGAKLERALLENARRHRLRVDDDERLHLINACAFFRAKRFRAADPASIRGEDVRKAARELDAVLQRRKQPKK